MSYYCSNAYLYIVGFPAVRLYKRHHDQSFYFNLRALP